MFRKTLHKIRLLLLPHKDNNSVPHILHEASIGSLLVFVIVSFVLVPNFLRGAKFANHFDLTASIYPAVIVNLTNDVRVQNHLNTLTRNQILDKVAELKAEDMLAHQYFAHNSPTGVTPWHWFDEAHYAFVYAGENLAVDFSDTNDVQNAWLASPSHRANILNSHFTEMGIAVRDGTFEGKPTTFVVETFASPARVSTTNTIAVAPTKTETPKAAPQAQEKSSVAGAAVGKSPLEVITEDQTHIVVKNIEAEEAATSSTEDFHQSLYTLLVTDPALILKVIYAIIAGLLIFATLGMLSREYQKRHKLHALYATLLVIIMLVLLYIARGYFSPALL